MFTIEESKISKDAADYIRNNKPENVYSALEIGVFVTNKIQLKSDIDFVKNQIDNLLNSTTNVFQGLSENYQKIIAKVTEERFDPNVPNSYPKRFGDFLNNSAGDFKNTVSLQLQGAKDLLNKIEENTSEKESSSLGRVKKMILDTQNFIQGQFDESSTTSYSYQLKQKLNETFVSLDDKLRAAMENKIRSEFSLAIKPIMDEFSAIRDIISKEQGKSEVMELASQKGFIFEDELFQSLQEIAAPFGDSVEETADSKEITGSKKGDFMYYFSELGSKIIIEAKDKIVRQKESLDYMKLALASRGCDFGILVAKSSDQLQKQIGKWNFYDNVIICSSDNIEISIRFARFLIQFRKVKTEGINIGEVKSKITKLLDEIKKFQTVRTNLTNIKQAVEAGTDKIRADIDAIQDSIKSTLQELELTIK